MIEITPKKVADLIPYARNSRTHSDTQISQIAGSIKEFGFTSPIALDGENGILAGHGRLAAAKMLDIEEVPTVDLGYMSKTQQKAYIIADNKLALNAGWDDEMLALEMKGLEELDFDLDLIGFDSEELEELSIIDDEPNAAKDPEEENYREVFNIIIECDNEQSQESIYNKLSSEGYSCQVQSL